MKCCVLIPLPRNLLYYHKYEVTYISKWLLIYMIYFNFIPEVAFEKKGHNRRTDRESVNWFYNLSDLFLWISKYRKTCPYLNRTYQHLEYYNITVVRVIVGYNGVQFARYSNLTFTLIGDQNTTIPWQMTSNGHTGVFHRQIKYKKV